MCIRDRFWGTQGLLGTGIGVSATYIFLFVVFGAFLKYSGFSRFINDFSLTLVGQTAGGPAKVAVLASALTVSYTHLILRTERGSLQAGPAGPGHPLLHGAGAGLVPPGAVRHAGLRPSVCHALPGPQ